MAEESAAVCSVYGLQRTHRIVNGDDSAVFRFFVPGDLDLWPLTWRSNFGEIFYTLHLTAKFHHPTFNRSEVIVLTNKQTNWQTDKLDSMRWFSHRRSRVTSCLLWRHDADPIVSCCLLRMVYGARLIMHCQWGWDSILFVFCPWWPWSLILTLTFELLWRDFCTVHLIAGFHHPTFNRSEVIVRTNKQTDRQTDAAENIHLAPLCYAGG